MFGQTGRTILCCVLLWSPVLTDAYGLSQKTTNNNKKDKQTTLGKTVKQSTVAAYKRDLGIDKSFLKTTQPVKVTVDGKTRPENKAVLEIHELQRMYQRLNQEKVGKTEFDRKQQVLKHIENQIQLRQRAHTEQQLLQQQQQKSRNRQAGHKPQLAQSRQVHQLFDIDSMQSVSLNPGQHQNTLHDINQHIVASNQNQQAQTPVLNKHALPNTRLQNQVVIPQTHVQHFIQREPLRLVDTRSVNRPVVQQVAPQQHILVPVSALSSGQILNGQGMLSDNIVFVNSLAKNEAQAGPRAMVSQIKQPNQPPTTTMETTTPIRTTERPVTTAPTPPSTSPRDTATESSTAMDLETMKQSLLESSLKKQSLEIKKLQLEIRALQRQERKSLPEENEDGPQRRRFGRRPMVFPFNR